MKRNIAKFVLPMAAALLATSCAITPMPSSMPSGGGSSSSSSSSSYRPSSSSTSEGIPTKYRVTLYVDRNNDPVSYDIEQGKNLTAAKAGTPQKAGYAFEGWCTEYDPATRMGKEGTEISFPYKPSGSLVLYARFSKASAASHTEEEIAEYVAELQRTSQADHVYFHYYRFENTAESYSDWDIWCWPYRPTEGEGARFDWVGRSTSADFLDADGDAIIDDFGGAVVDIDLQQTYEGGTKDQGHAIGGKTVDFHQRGSELLDTQIGIQVVKSSSRRNPEGKFWTNDGGDLHVDLTDPDQALELETNDGGKAWHVFALQDQVADYSSEVINDLTDPFEDDDGTNITYARGKSTSIYNDVDWDNPAAIAQTSPGFASSVGVGYQIQVATFADSDGDGFGDIYGITSRVNEGYFDKLGVKALWLTPVQKSDSYHGYDISNYLLVDEKFGSSASTAASANGGIKTAATSMADYEELLNVAHQHGIKIVMDLVLNHTSTSNKWFINSAQLDAAYRGYYQWGNHETDSTVTEDRCWYPYGDHAYSYYAKFGSSMPELNYQYKSTREAVETMSLYWCEKGVDGFRLDAVKHIFMTDETTSGSKDTIIVDQAEKGDYSSNLTKNLHFYRELNKVVKAKYPDTFFVGENFDGHAYHVSPWYQAFDSMFDFYGYFNLTTAAAKAIGSYSGAGNTFDTLMSTGGKFQLDSSIDDKGGIYNGVAGVYSWDLPSAVASYNRYRSNGKAMPGFFTSNHDIARVINRIAGTEGDSNGITEQGTITIQNYDTYRKAADLVKAAEILMPGCTWIYYGDEIGMTGNFPSGKDSTSDYADLWWRQPMKWTASGEVGDGSMTTGFSITGSGSAIVYDEVNKSAKVVPALTQASDANSQFSKLAKVVKFKNANPAMITGDLSNAGSTATVLKFTNGGVTITIDFSSGNVSASGGNGSLNVTF